MFFMMGITDGQKRFDFTQTIICNCCGAYGRYEVFMTFTVLSLFFIPCFRWNKRYFVRTTCCNTIYALDREKGKRIAAGENIEIQPEDLTLVNRQRSSYKHCSGCGFSTSEDYEYCPRCGRPLDESRQNG